MKSVITEDIECFIKENYLKMPSRSIAGNFQISKTAVLRFLKKHGLIIPPSVILEWRKRKIKNRIFTNNEKQFIIDNIRTMSIKSIARSLKTCNLKVRQLINELGLQDIVLEKALKSRIQKGSIPPNKGKKIAEYMNAEQIAKFKENQYKPGHLPHNTIADGKEVQRIGKNGKIYLFIKLPGNRKVIPKHIHVWEIFHNRKVPKGYNVIFKDGDTINIAIENLECISNAELMLRNSLHNYPEEIKEIIMLKGQITRQINKSKKT